LKIFIEIPTWLGDAVMATPAIENIIKSYPDAQLVIFGSFVSTKLFINHPSVDKIIIDKSKKEGNRYKNLFSLAKSVGKVDISLSFRKNFTTKFLLFFINTTQKFIYKRFDNELNTHQVIRYNDFINKSLSLDTNPDELKIYIPHKKENNSKQILGLNPGATYGSAKRWYPDEFAKVAIELSKTHDIKIFGGPGETDIAGDIESKLNNAGVSNFKNLAGKTSVEELLENIATLDLFVTNDSGPMHVAAAFNIPTVSIFGPTRHNETNQWKNEYEMLLRKDIECAPCMKRTCPLKGEQENHACMKEITSLDVINRLHKESII
jgi:heptosyltransferase-2